MMTVRDTMNERWRDWTPWLATRAGEIGTALAFSTRLPLGRFVPADGNLAQAVWALPLAGLVVGIVGAAVYALAHRLGLPPWPAAALALAATLAVTGALHEDGLADTADGFGGGQSREQKLAIMRDSRIGTYGVCALALALLLRASAVATLAAPGAVAAALIASHTAGRAAVPLLMFFVGPARADGLSYAAGRPAPAGAVAAAVIGLVVLVAGLGFVPAIEAAVVLVAVIALMGWLSVRQVGGQTGDVLGALEQVSEIVILLVAVR
jgi:adenosylcobinamide-GDP ribazoletransferase